VYVAEQNKFLSRTKKRGTMNINWYPGHMKKTRALLIQNLRLVDIVFEVLDARIPISSRNPDLTQLLGQKSRIILLNKSDLSSEAGNRQWLAYFETQQIPAIALVGNKQGGMKHVLQIAETLQAKKTDRARIKRPLLGVMVAGVPNVGKSTIINSLAGRKGAQTGNRPGITRSKQWIKLPGKLEMLDTPGLLWPKFEDEQVMLHLAMTGAIKDELIDVETIALRLVERLAALVPAELEERYKVNVSEQSPTTLLGSIALKRGCLTKNQGIDYTKVANVLLNDYRKGTLGRITLEYPPI
jgi:ribosome biogenesis GTPase A